MNSDEIGALVRRFGSPLYVYDLRAVDAAWKTLRDALPLTSTVFFSLKANPHVDIARRLRALGAHAEVSSLGELETALRAGFAPAQILFTGPAKTAVRLERAMQLGVRRFSVESLTDLRRTSAAAEATGVEVDAIVRVNLEVPITRALAFSGPSAHFGIPLSDLVEALPEVTSTPHVRLLGAHFFLATNIDELDVLCACFRDAIAASKVLAERGLRLSLLDLGGGFAAPYARRGALGTFPDLRDRLSEMLDGAHPEPPALWFESGRFLVGSCGSLVCSVLDVKTLWGERFVVVDSGIHHLGGMSGLRRVPPLAPELVTRAGADAHSARLVGELCTSLDCWSTRAQLPSVEAGDLLVIPNVGAYGLTASLLGFLSHEAPAEVVVSADGIVSATRLSIARSEFVLRSDVAMVRKDVETP